MINGFDKVDLIYLDKGEIIDDLGEKLNANVKDPKNFVSEDEKDVIGIDNTTNDINSKNNLKLNFCNDINIKKEIESLENKYNENLSDKMDEGD